MWHPKMKEQQFRKKIKFQKMKIELVHSIVKRMVYIWPSLNATKNTLYMACDDYTRKHVFFHLCSVQRAVSRTNREEKKIDKRT